MAARWSAAALLWLGWRWVADRPARRGDGRADAAGAWRKQRRARLAPSERERGWPNLRGAGERRATSHRGLSRRADRACRGARWRRMAAADAAQSAGRADMGAGPLAAADLRGRRWLGDTGALHATAASRGARRAADDSAGPRWAKLGAL